MNNSTVSTQPAKVSERKMPLVRAKFEFLLQKKGSVCIGKRSFDSFDSFIQGCHQGDIRWLNHEFKVNNQS